MNRTKEPQGSHHKRHAQWVKSVIVGDAPEHGLAGLVRAGPFLFTAGCDGDRELGSGRIAPELAGNVERQCENAYGRIGALLRRGGAELSRVVRLDHFTSSQDWLPRRQAIRARLFGRPAPLASTGVAARMSDVNMLTAFAIAVADPADKEVLVEGPRFGMGNICSAVRGGPFIFVSGIRGAEDPRSGHAVEEETADSLFAQLRLCYAIIKSILTDTGTDTGAILRLDCYVRDITRSAENTIACREILGDVHCASTVVGLPLGGRGDVEITTIALAPGHAKRVLPPASAGLPCVVDAGGFLFVGECRGNVSVDTGQPDPALVGDRSAQVSRALQVLEASLRRAGSGPARVARIEIYLRDIHFAGQAEAILGGYFGTNPPVVAVIGADLGGALEAKLNAIAL